MSYNSESWVVRPISDLREELRLRSASLVQSLLRSVSRLTSADEKPCEEYEDVVAEERTIMDEILYVQCCRNAVEQCISRGAATIRFRRRDGTVVITRFKKIASKRMKVSGLV